MKVGCLSWISAEFMTVLPHVVRRCARNHTLLVTFALGALSGTFHAQSYLTSTGSPGFGAAYPVEMGTIDAATGNLHLEIPLGSFPQRGGASGDLKIAYDSHFWSIQNPGSYWMPYNAPLYLLNGGWYVVSSQMWFVPAMPDFGVCTWDQKVWEPNGIQHWFHMNLGSGTLSSGCTLSSANSYAVDSSGLRLYVTYQHQQPYLTFSLYAPDGTLLTVTTDGSSVTGSYNYPLDTNGNYLSGAGGAGSVGNDTLGRQYLQTPSSPASCEFTSANPGGQYYACYDVLNAQGGTSRYTLSFADIPLKTAFHWSGVSECVTNCWITVLTRINLPDGSSYSFKYDCDSTTGISACNMPGGQTAYYGTLTQMTLPTGDQITYGYSLFGGVSWGNNQNQFPSWWVTFKSSSAGAWTYTPTATAGAGPSNICLPGYQVGCSQSVVQRPDGSKETTTFIVDPLGGSYPQTIQSYDTNGTTLLSTVANTWDFSQACTLSACPSGEGYQDVRKLSASTTIPNPTGNITKKTTFAYDSPQTGNITAIKEWKYQYGSFSSTADRATYITYASIPATNVINKPQSVAICNNTGTDSDCPGGGSKVSKSLITYDGYGANGSLALSSITGVQNHNDTTFGTAYTARGNPTLVQQWVTGTTYLMTARLSYDTTGQVIQSLDSAGTPTTLSYTNSFYDDNGSNPPAPHSGAPKTNAYVTTITDALGTTAGGYYYGTGQIAFSTDYNSQYTYSHYLDFFSRPTETEYPIGWELDTYPSPTQADSYSAVADTAPSTSCSSCIHSQALVDSLGRVTAANLVNNPAGEVTVASAYDGLNQLVSSSYPHIGAGDPNNVSEKQYYDGLGRATEIRHADGQGVRTAYGARVSNLGGLASQQSSTTTYGVGFPVVTVDEAGKQRQEWLDGFGHVIEVDEPASATASPSSTTITVSGSEGSHYTCSIKSQCPTPVPDTGSVTVTINGYSATASWSSCSTAATVAANLAVALSSPNSPVTAAANGTNIRMQTVGFSPSFTVTENNPYGDFSVTPTSGTISGGSGGIQSSSNVTAYTYDALGNLTGVAQGVQSRSYQYDGLGRLTQEITPEGGKITLSYVKSGGGVCSGNPSSPCTRTAPAPNQTGTATVTTTFTYNAVNQLTQKTHSDSSGTEIYTYGTSATSFNVGRLASMSDPSGSEGYSYNAAGDVTKVVKVIGSTTYNLLYGYNAGGQLTSITYPSGRTVQYSYDRIGHLCVVAATATSCSSYNNPYLTLSSTGYDAAGRPLSFTYGNGVVGNVFYSPLRSQLTSIRYSYGNTPLFGLVYSYQNNANVCPTGNSTGNNGQVQCITDFVQPGRSSSYTYDPLGRMSSATTSGNTAYPRWSLTFAYDRYGNRTAQTVTAGSGYNSSLSFNAANNQITGYSYDAAGNVTAQPSPSATYTYDGEQCNTGYSGGSSTASYNCDGNGVRVKKVVTGSNAVTTVYIRSVGQVIAEYDNGAAVISPTREYIYGTTLLATITGSTGGSGGAIVYQQRDHLSPRLYTDASGNEVGEQGSYPFGEAWYNNNSNQTWVFTTYERDQENGNDYALARSYANNQGRFLSPDPLEGIVGDPQSWNRYAYVENDPINSTDPSGQGFWSWLGMEIANLFIEFVTMDLVSLNSPNSGFDLLSNQGNCLPGEPCTTWKTTAQVLIYSGAAVCASGVCYAGPPSSTGPPVTNAPESTGANPQGSSGGPNKGSNAPGGNAGSASGQGPASAGGETSNDTPISAMQTHVTPYNRPTWVTIPGTEYASGVWFLGRVVHYQLKTRTGANYLGKGTITENTDSITKSENVTDVTSTNVPFRRGKFQDFVGDVLGRNRLAGPEPEVDSYLHRVQSFTVNIGGSTRSLTTKVDQWVVVKNGKQTTAAKVIVP